MAPHISLQSFTIKPISFDSHHTRRVEWGDLRKFGYPSLIKATPFKSHILFYSQGPGFELTPTTRRLSTVEPPRTETL